MDTYTGYNDMYGRPLNIGDKVRLNKLYFKVDKNPFNGLYIIDGDTGQEFLTNVYKQVVKTVTDIGAHEICTKVLNLQHDFITRYAVRPNRAYIGSALLDILKEDMNNRTVPTSFITPVLKSALSIANLQVVEVTEDEHISVGLAV